MITPPISVTSAIEGLRQIPILHNIHEHTIIYCVIGILVGLFFIQQFGTKSIGKMFGPIMAIWFGMLLILGLSHINIEILKAFNPWYGLKILIQYPKGFWILGAVFLCTTGAEALYSDLGHCGKGNIRISWIFVKISLIITYLGQGSWLLTHKTGIIITDDMIAAGFNPFYGIMPEWFKLIGVVIATIAAIIASQALISGSFTLISEAIRLNLWPKMKIKYPTEAKGQLYIPNINMMLFVGCIAIVVYFKTSSAMAAAYGLAITLCMLSTSILFANYLIIKKTSQAWILLYLTIFIMIEISFLIANLEKFPEGGYVTIIVGSVLFGVMYIWKKSHLIKAKATKYIKISSQQAKLEYLSKIKTEKDITNLLIPSKAKKDGDVEMKLITSICNNLQISATYYWFIHIDPLKVNEEEELLSNPEPNIGRKIFVENYGKNIIKISAKLGFQENPNLHTIWLEAKEILEKEGWDFPTKQYLINGLSKSGDYKELFVEDFTGNGYTLFEKMVLDLQNFIKHTLPAYRWYGAKRDEILTDSVRLDKSYISE